MKDSKEKPQRTIAELMEEKGFDRELMVDRAFVTIKELGAYLDEGVRLDSDAFASVVKVLKAEQYEILPPLKKGEMRKAG